MQYLVSIAYTFFVGKQIKLYNSNIHEKIGIIYGIAIVKEM